MNGQISHQADIQDESQKIVLEDESQFKTRLSTSSEEETDPAPSLAEETRGGRRVPDGGWGWVVVLAAFIINLIADGVTLTFGVIYVQLLKHFREGKGKTAWIGGLFMAVPLMAGPVASTLCERWGCRRVCIVGALLSFFGFIITSLASSINVLIFTVGILTGIGLALCYLTALVVVAYYFDKRLSMATGISVCGSGIGTVIFAPLTSWLCREYGWRGTTLILAAIMLNMCACGAVMRDLPAQRERRKQMRNKQLEKNSDLQESQLENSKLQIQRRRSRSVIYLPTCENLTNNSKQNRTPLTIGSFRGGLVLSRFNIALSCPELDVLRSDDHLKKRQLRNAIKVLQNMPRIKRDVEVLLQEVLLLREKMDSLKIAIAKLNFCDHVSAAWRELLDILHDLVDLSHFLDLQFVVFAASNFLLFSWYHVPYVFLADKAVEMGFDETKASWLISILGLLNTLGEVIIGWLGDQPWVDVRLIYSFCMVTCGLFVGGVPWISSYEGLAILAGGFGLSVAANYTLIAVLLVDLLPIESFARAYGLLLLVQGIANLTGPPLAGWLYDVTRSYDLSFYLAGFFIILSGVLLVIVPRDRNRICCCPCYKSSSIMESTPKNSGTKLLFSQK